MRFSTSFLDDIRARVPISEIVGARVRFDPKKTNAARGDYWACCPFHGEKTPSFHCDNRRNIYHCFGCGASGDIFGFLTAAEGLSFHEAVERLAARAGIPMPKPDAAMAAREQKRDDLYDVLEMAAAFYERALQSDDAEAASARAYLRERQITASAQKQFRLGYAPGGNNALKQFLHGRNIDKNLQEQSGLFAESEHDGNAYDRFRNRIMFPITDIKGRVIAFGGRALSPQARAKYLNSPSTELFHKGKIVYNLAQARNAAANAGRMRAGGAETADIVETADINETDKSEADGRTFIVAEGYMDVVMLTQAGIGAAVAPLGTALTEEQLALIWRFCPQPVLCFDGDKAGVQAAYRALDRALPLLKTGFSLRFMLLPEGSDPDDIIRAGGRELFEELLSGAENLADVMWKRALAGQDFTTPESRAALQKQLYDSVETIQDKGLRYYYRQDIWQRLRAYFAEKGQIRRQGGFFGAESASGNAFSRSGFRNYQRKNGFYAAYAGQTGIGGGSLVSKTLTDSPLVRSAGNGKGSRYAFTAREAAILALLLRYPRLWHENFDVLAALEWKNAKLQDLHKAMLEVLAEEQAVWQTDAAHSSAVKAEYTEAAQESGSAAMLEKLEQKGQKSVADEILAFAANLGTARAQNLTQARESLNQALALYLRAHSLHKQMREIEADLRENPTSRNFARLSAFREELRRTDDLAAAPDEV